MYSSQKGTDCRIKNPEKNTMTAALVMVCAPVAGLRVPSCCRCLWQSFRLSPLRHRSLEGALVSVPFQSVPLLLRPEKQNSPRSFRCWSDFKKNSHGEFKPSLPRSSTLDLPSELQFRREIERRRAGQRRLELTVRVFFKIRPAPKTARRILFFGTEEKGNRLEGNGNQSTFEGAVTERAKAKGLP